MSGEGLQSQGVARTPLIAGNWKMNMDHLQAIALVQKLAWLLKDARHDYTEVEAAVFPPFTALRSVQTLLAADKLHLVLGAQDVSAETAGAFTGEVSAQMLQKLETRYVIVGHSERRARFGEDDALVGRKAAAAVSQGITPVICVGETAADLEEHGAAAIPVQQVHGALAELAPVLQKLRGEGRLADDAGFVIAYEPVWAIGSGQAATPQQAQQVCAAIRGQIAEQLGSDVSASVRILYGGSVTSDNIGHLMRESDIDGALVGGASLKAEEFARIVQYKKHVVA